jgi:hypothetical protein
MPNFGQHTKHSKNSASNFHDAKFLGTLEPLSGVELFPSRIPSITKLWWQNFGGKVWWLFLVGTIHQTLVSKFPGVSMYEPHAKLWCRSSVGIPHMVPKFGGDFIRVKTWN